MSFESKGPQWNPTVQGAKFGQNSGSGNSYQSQKRKDKDEQKESYDAFVYTNAKDEDIIEIYDNEDNSSSKFSFVKFLQNIVAKIKVFLGVKPEEKKPVETETDTNKISFKS